MNILITTGIYPPKIGGPAQYSKELKSAFEKTGHVVRVSTFSVENYFPTGLRHLFFLFKIIPRVLFSDLVIIMDTFSVALPSIIASKLFGKKSVIRTGGDFLWEQYVERTGKKVIFKDFYKTERVFFSQKDKIIFALTKWTLNNASEVVFSTPLQRDIFISAYSMDHGKTLIIENFYGPKKSTEEPEGKVFIASSRNLVLKNVEVLKRVFIKIRVQYPEVQLFLDILPSNLFLEKIKKSYAMIQISLSEISPNAILDSIQFNKPFICTREVGIFHRIKDAGMFVDPLNEEEIERAILSLLNEDEYKKACDKVKQFSFIHTWEEIAEEFLEVFKTL